LNKRIGEGCNLDAKIKPEDFVSPDGDKGSTTIYRALGARALYASPDCNGPAGMRSNDKMLRGLYTIVIRISGT